MPDPTDRLRALLQEAFAAPATAEPPKDRLERLERDLEAAFAELLSSHDSATTPFVELRAMARAASARSRTAPDDIVREHFAWLRKERGWYKPVRGPDGRLSPPELPDGVLSVPLAVVPRVFERIRELVYQLHRREKAPPNELDPYDPFEPIVSTECQGASNPGYGYQWLSKATGALRFPVCNYQSYDSVFQHIAAGVLEVTGIPCRFEVPETPRGEMLDLSTVELHYAPGMDPPQIWTLVPGPQSCGPGFYLEGNEVVLCPETCATVESDASAMLQVTVQYE
jgi:hypothetical protein